MKKKHKHNRQLKKSTKKKSMKKRSRSKSKKASKMKKDGFNGHYYLSPNSGLYLSPVMMDPFRDYIDEIDDQSIKAAREMSILNLFLDPSPSKHSKKNPGPDSLIEKKSDISKTSGKDSLISKKK